MSQRRNVLRSKKIKMITYPSRIEEWIVRDVNKVRKAEKLSWPQLTMRLLRSYLADRKAH